jgi:hypothetical protein
MSLAESFLAWVWSRIDQALVVQVVAVLLLLVVAFLSGRYFGRRPAAAEFDGDFSQAVSCDTCDRPLRVPGGILLGPPTADGFARQQHICVECYPLFVATVVSILGSNYRLKDTVTFVQNT